MAEINYNGTVDLISGLRPKNNGTFPLIEAHDILFASGGCRLDVLVSGFTGPIKTYIENQVELTNQRTDEVVANLDERINEITDIIGTGGTIDSKISTAVNNESVERANADEALGNRITALEEYEANNNKVQKSNINGNLKLNGVEVKVYDDTSVTSQIEDINSRLDTINTKIAKIEKDSIIVNENVNDINAIVINDGESLINAGASVTASSVNGNIKVNGTEMKVYDDTNIEARVAALEEALSALLGVNS